MYRTIHIPSELQEVEVTCCSLRDLYAITFLKKVKNYLHFFITNNKVIKMVASDAL